eukprot:TRINITY_DN1412_c0_g1_i13.p1 TRINITY_DN1412_c0_g1~~TRINITY_DN1412_c0_g1_i13.p1  ORF type:complete len:682 (+),score=173.83 TRINITY_DN1412_c0_g1_i13:532-2577(+)
MKFPMGDQDEQDLLDRIAALRGKLIRGFQSNAKLESEHKRLEDTIGLLISHRSSIIELDRQRQKRKQGPVHTTGERAQFINNKSIMEHYSHLFYLLRTEPSYLAKLSFLLPADEGKKKSFAETCILTMYANAFSPLEELLLLELLSLALKSEVEHSKDANNFLEQDGVGIMMVISYNKRKQGKTYVRNTFKDSINDLEKEELFGSSLTEDAKIQKLTEWCEVFFGLIIDSLDRLPFGIRYLCNQLIAFFKATFPSTPYHTCALAVGYVVFYRFLNLIFIKPQDWGLVEEDVANNATFVFNMTSISKVLKSLFTNLQELRDDPKLSGMNPWIKSKIPQAQEYLKAIPDVIGVEEYLQVNKYAQLGKKESDSIVIKVTEIVFIHDLLRSNIPELTEDEDDPLRKILNDLGDVPACPPGDDTEYELVLKNRFPPKLSKMDQKKNLKTETIDAAIKIMQKLPGFTGNTFLEIFVRMKLHLKKLGDTELSAEVHNVIANLQNLAKYGLISADDGYNGFLVDIQQELAARGRRRAEQIKEIERLTTAIEELDEQEVFMKGKINDFNAYLDSIRGRLRNNFQVIEKTFSYKQLTNKKLNIIHSSEIPETQQSKVKFTIVQQDIEQFVCRGRIKGLPLFKREFKLDLEQLLRSKEEGQNVFDTNEGLELDVQNTLIFLNKNFFACAKKR